jgi:hypothetical protein
MGRKPTDNVSLKLRLREALRRKIEKAAEKKKISTNAEAVERIEQTFEEEERWEAAHKDLEEDQERFDKMHEEFLKDQERERILHETALRDSAILGKMIESQRGSAYLIRRLARELGNNPEWAATDESKKDFADRLHRFIMNADFREPTE